MLSKKDSSTFCWLPKPILSPLGVLAKPNSSHESTSRGLQEVSCNKESTMIRPFGNHLDSILMETLRLFDCLRKPIIKTLGVLSKPISKPLNYFKRFISFLQQRINNYPTSFQSIGLSSNRISLNFWLTSKTNLQPLRSTSKVYFQAMKLVPKIWKMFIATENQQCSNHF